MYKIAGVEWENNGEFQPYQPVYDRFTEIPAIPPYYELRIWRHHIMVFTKTFNKLIEAKSYYKKMELDISEEENLCYVEIIHVKPLKKHTQARVKPTGI